MLNLYEENRRLYSSPTDGPAFDSDRASLLSAWLKGIPDISRSLDIGCYSGGFSALLPEKVEKSGLDFVRHPSLPDSFEFYSCDISEDWQVPQESFDVVLAGEVIEHVLDTQKFLRQCFNALRPSGYLLLTTPNLASFANLKYWIQADQYMWVDSDANQWGHVRYLAPKRMKGALQQAGFIDIIIQSVSGIESLQFFPPLRRLIQKVFPLRGNRLCVLARKP
jgi:SAM-dependent methyltransferase